MIRILCRGFGTYLFFCNKKKTGWIRSHEPILFLNTRKPNPNREAVPFTYNYKYNCINNGQWLMNTVSSTYILTLHDTHHTLQIPSWNKTFIHLG
jgi:hypothetical protein